MGFLRIIGAFLGEALGTCFDALINRFFPKKTVGEQKQQDRADSATEALKINEAMQQAAENAPTSVDELKSTLDKGQL